MSLRARMGLAAGLAVAVAVVAVSASAYIGTRSAVYGQIDASLRTLAEHYLQPPASPGGGRHAAPGVINGGRGGAGNGGGSITQAADLRNRSDRHGYAPFFASRLQHDCDQGLGANVPGTLFGGATGDVQVLKPSGSICQAPGLTKIPITSRARQIASSGRGSYFTSTTAKGQHIRVLVQGVGGIGALMLALPLMNADSTLSSELLVMGLIAAAGVALAALLGLAVARTAVAPISRFTRQTERIAEHPERLEHERLLVTGDDELARLAGAFNATLDALESSIVAQRNLVADASHELRTPISTLRANLQLLRDEERLSEADRAGLRADMIEELDELTKLVGDVVELARGSKPPGEAGEVRLDQIVADALTRARRRGPGLSFDAALEPTLIQGDGERVARAVTNVLDNALKWSPGDGTVEVTLRDGVLAVRDHGPGFHDEDLPFVFDRFHRARDARSKPGSGLGLAIVRQATEAHGGFAEANNAPGGGALIRISFGPAAGSPAEALASASSSDTMASE